MAKAIWGYCSICENEIYEGDDVYIIIGQYFCDECMREHKHVAGENTEGDE